MPTLHRLAQDGGILMSLRHQDWILKVDYGNGTGTGNILWRLALDGDFTIVGDPNDSPVSGRATRVSGLPGSVSPVMLRVWQGGDETPT